MAWQLNPDTSFCIVSRAAVFLDLAGDRYFALSEPMTAQWNAWIAARCPDPLPPVAAMLAQADVLQRRPGCGSIRPAAIAVPSRSLERARQGTLRTLATSVAAHACRRRIGHRLRRHGLKGMIACARQSRLSSQITTMPEEPAAAFAAALAGRAPEDDCLRGSFALLDYLHRRDSDASAVFGVAASPFRAHCWVQSPTRVLNDDADHVRAFTPILRI